MYRQSRKELHSLHLLLPSRPNQQMLASKSCKVI